MSADRVVFHPSRADRTTVDRRPAAATCTPRVGEPVENGEGEGTKGRRRGEEGAGRYDVFKASNCNLRRPRARVRYPSLHPNPRTGTASPRINGLSERATHCRLVVYRSGLQIESGTAKGVGAVKKRGAPPHARTRQ